MLLPSSKIIYAAILILLSQYFFSQETAVKYSGKKSKIGQEKRVDAAIMVDSIKGNHLYAIGPVENLRGEILVWDGKPFVAAITDDKKPHSKKISHSLYNAQSAGVFHHPLQAPA